jgi:cytochrome P450
MSFTTEAWVGGSAVLGNDPDAFRPERWLEDGSGQMERFFFAFGAGARLCISKKPSRIEMSKMIPLLLLHYDINLADPQAEWKENF